VTRRVGALHAHAIIVWGATRLGDWGAVSTPTHRFLLRTQTELISGLEKGRCTSTSAPHAGWAACDDSATVLVHASLVNARSATFAGIDAWWAGLG
jgi:hypothetical protein